MLALAPILFSCGDDEETQIGLPPQNDLGIFFVEIPMRDVITQVWADNVTSRATDAMMAGGYTDENFGVLKAQHFAEILLPSLNPGKNFGADANYDSLVLELRISGTFGNQLATTTQQIEVYQLQDTIRAFESNYFNNSKQEVGMKFGEAFFRVYPDSIGLEFTDTDIPESLRGDNFDENDVYIYKTRVRFDDNFGREFFTDLKTDTTESSPFASSRGFADYFKGLNIRGGDMNTAIMRYTPADVRTRLVMHYSQTEDDTLRSKTLGFPISRTINYNNIEPNADVPWMGSSLDQVTEFFTRTKIDTGYALLQAGTHMFVALDMTKFQTFADTVENAIIQSAELVLANPFGEQNDDQVQKALPTFVQFTVTSVDSLSAGFPDVIPEIFSELPDKDVQFDEDINGYRVEIPVYLQGLLDQRNDLDQLIISLGAVESTGGLRFDNASFRQAIFDTDDIVVRMYYTIPESSNNE